jgi:hypothetical protein
MRAMVVIAVVLSGLLFFCSSRTHAQETDARCACCGGWIKLTSTGGGFDRKHVHICDTCNSWLKSDGRPTGPETWNRVIDPPVHNEAVRRFLLTREGTWLIAALATKGIKVKLSFGSTDPVGGHDMSGGFSPAEPGRKKYTVYIKHGDAVPTGTTGPSFYGSANCPANTNVFYHYKEAESEDAESIYHELLHIWFINQIWRPTPIYPTGHGSWSDCEIEGAFLNKLKVSVSQLDSLEQCLDKIKKL